MQVRLYPINGKNYPSVTSILSGVFGVGEHLNRWSVKKGAEAILSALEKAEEDGIELDYDELLEIAQQGREVVLKKAQHKGTLVHKWVQDKAEFNIDPESIDPEYFPYYKAFLKFLEEHEVKPIKQEWKVWNDTYEYAGRLDYYGRITCVSCKCERKLHDTLCLLDFKTSKSLRTEYELQLAAYKECLERMGVPVEATFLLHLKESGRYKFVETNEPFAAFANVIPVFRWRMSKERAQITYASEEEAIAQEMKTPVSEDTGEFNEPSHSSGDTELPHPSEWELPPLETEMKESEPALPIKRKRGRPRKHPLPQDAELETGNPRHNPTEIELDPKLLKAVLARKSHILQDV